MGECADCFQNATSRKVTWTGSGGLFGTRDNAKYLDGKPDLTAARKRDSLKFGHGMQDFFGSVGKSGLVLAANANQTGERPVMSPMKTNIQSYLGNDYLIETVKFRHQTSGSRRPPIST